MTITTDPNHPELTRGVDKEPTPQAKVYLALSPEELAKGFIRPLRYNYTHRMCGTSTRMPAACAETYARQPDFYGATYCCACQKHLPVSEFHWEDDGSVVGS